MKVWDDGRKFREFINSKKVNCGIEILAFFAVLACVWCSIKMNLVGRTLWLDEAMLAISLNKRSLFELCMSPLEWNQSAPVGYLLMIKIIISLLGNSEFVFRLFSIFAYVILLAAFYVVVKRIVKLEYPMLCTAGLANVAFLLEYSNMFKPYICDALCVMLVLLFYYWYKEEKMKFWMLCLVYFILIWFSNPVAFFSGGVVAYEVLKAMWKKDKQNFWRGMVLGITICVSFLIMYIVWLKPTIATTNLSEFWEGYEFPFWVGSMKELKWAIHLIAFVTQGAGPLWKVILLLAAAAVLLNIIVVRNDYIWALTLGIVITLVASHFGFFPMSDRMFLFLIPILVLLAAFMVKWLTGRIAKPQYMRICLAAILVIFLATGTGFTTYDEGIAYRAGEESNESLSYIQENITQDDLIYVYYPAIPVFQYKMGYDTTSVCGFEDNVYLGHGFFCKDGGSPEDIEYISGQKGIYVLFSHVVDYEPTDNLMNVLNEKGTLEKIHDQYLFYYSCDGSQSKADISCELLSAETEEDGHCRAVIKIRNEGDTYLNNGRETFCLHSTEYDVNYYGQEKTVIGDIAPGASAEVAFEFDWKDEEEETKAISLFNVGKYDMISENAEPLVIRR